ncbi:MAG TPA: hypothetical protein VIK72_16995 [Clostridiaceae bacterium]
MNSYSIKYNYKSSIEYITTCEANNLKEAYVQASKMIMKDNMIPQFAKEINKKNLIVKRRYKHQYIR